MPSALEELRKELLIAKATLLPQIEGFHDFSRLNLLPDSIPVINDAIIVYERRLALIDATLLAIDALILDLYPSVPHVEALPQVFRDLAANVTTISAAFDQVTPIVITSSISLGTIVPK